jgi:hypothetical protein
MSKGLVPPIQLYPTDKGQLQIEIEHEEDEGLYARTTLSRQQVKHLINMLQDWCNESEIDELTF